MNNKRDSKTEVRSRSHCFCGKAVLHIWVWVCNLSYPARLEYAPYYIIIWSPSGYTKCFHTHLEHVMFITRKRLALFSGLSRAKATHLPNTSEVPQKISLSDFDTAWVRDSYNMSRHVTFCCIHDRSLWPLSNTEAGNFFYLGKNYLYFEVTAGRTAS